jgi:hypothetical protein
MYEDNHLPISFPHQPVDLKLIISLAFEYVRIFGKITIHRYSICEANVDLIKDMLI